LMQPEEFATPEANINVKMMIAEVICKA